MLDEDMGEPSAKFVLPDAEAEVLASTCCGFIRCGQVNSCMLTVDELASFIGPLCADHERVRRVLADEYEHLEESLELAAKFGGWYQQAVEQIRERPLVRAIVFLFQRLWAHEKDTLATL